MRCFSSSRLELFTLLVVLFCGSVVVEAKLAMTTASFIGGDADTDAVVAAGIQSDGSIILAANLSEGFKPGEAKLIPLNKDVQGQAGVVLRLDKEGKKVLSVTVVSQSVCDMSLDKNDRIALACEEGVMVLDKTASKKEWAVALDGGVRRIDMGPEGHVAALASVIHVYDPKGKELTTFPGKHRTEDLCIDEKSKTVIFVCWRQARAFDGKKTYPVQIAGMLAYDFEGKQKWNNYNWSTKRDAEDFLNKSTNNMADTRGYRISMGEDGNCYAAFESAGGNHIFRWQPKDIMKKANMLGGDRYHQFYNTRSEHKTVFCSYDPKTGDVLKVQEFCGRLSNGRGNTVRMKEAAIHADAEGRVYLAGNSGVGLPITDLPPDTGDYTGGGFILAMQPNLTEREYCTRLEGGKAPAHALAVRTINKKRIIVFAGSGATEAMFTKEAWQDKPRGEADGYWAVVKEE